MSLNMSYFESEKTTRTILDGVADVPLLLMRPFVPKFIQDASIHYLHARCGHRMVYSSLLMEGK